MDLKELKEILQILDEKEIAEFELEEQGIKLRIKKAAAGSGGSAVASFVAAATPAAALPPAPTGPVAVETRGAESPAPVAARPAAVDEGLQFMKSPIVGTFYRARDPNSAPFVEVGDRVKAGQVICIIEAMKMMNEIETDIAGEVVRVVPDNGQPVQYGDPLFAIRP